MMETERRPSTAPSRYKSVRRKTAAAAPAPPVPPLPLGVPQIPGQHYIPIQRAQQLLQSPITQDPAPVQTREIVSPVRQQPAPQRQQTLVERASPAKYGNDAGSVSEAQQEHGSRFRKMLRLRTKALDQQTESPTTSPSSASPNARRAASRHRRDEELHRREPSPEEMERQRARDDAVAALEGKRPSRPSSKARTPIDEQSVRCTP